LLSKIKTLDQRTSNQELELRQVAERMGCEIVKVYKDHGISGAKGRDGRPEFDRMCRDAAKRQFDVVMAWSVDRLGRSLQDLVGFLSELHALKIDLFLHQQGLDTTTPAGKAMFQQLGRPPIAPELQARIRDALRARESMRKIAARLGVSTNTVLKVSRVPFEATSAAAP
jgi:DNA invertase Pin-like site-specific DNA recombinase